MDSERSQMQQVLCSTKVSSRMVLTMGEDALSGRMVKSTAETMLIIRNQVLAKRPMHQVIIIQVVFKTTKSMVKEYTSAKMELLILVNSKMAKGMDSERLHCK